MIAAFALLLLCQLAGEILVRLLDVPVPGPVAGLVLLALGIALRHRLSRLWKPAAGAPLVPATVHDAAHGILRNLSLLFVPAAVGIVQQADVLAAHATALIAALVASTVAAMAVAALTFRLASRLAGNNTGAAAADKRKQPEGRP